MYSKTLFSLAAVSQIIDQSLAVDCGRNVDCSRCIEKVTLDSKESTTYADESGLCFSKVVFDKTVDTVSFTNMPKLQLDEVYFQNTVNVTFLNVEDAILLDAKFIPDVFFEDINGMEFSQCVIEDIAGGSEVMPTINFAGDCRNLNSVNTRFSRSWRNSCFDATACPEQVDFSGSKFVNTVFEVGSTAYFTNSNFQNTEFTNSKFTSATLDLSNSDFSGSKWLNVIMSENNIVLMYDCNLSGATFKGITFGALITIPNNDATSTGITFNSETLFSDITFLKGTLGCSPFKDEILAAGGSIEESPELEQCSLEVEDFEEEEEDVVDDDDNAGSYLIMNFSVVLLSLATFFA